MRSLKVLLVLGCLLLVFLFKLAQIDFSPPEVTQDDPVKAPAPSGLAWLFERFKLPQMSFDVLRKSEAVPKAATLPRPVDLRPEDPNSLPRASAAFPDFAAIRDTKMRKKSFFEFMAPLIEAENIQIEKSASNSSAYTKACNRVRNYPVTTKNGCANCAKNTAYQPKNCPWTLYSRNC